MQISARQFPMSTLRQLPAGELNSAPTKQEEQNHPVDSFSPLWTSEGAEPAKQPKSPPPALERPVIFLHGFNGSAEGWGQITDWLSSGQEPVNKDGGILEPGKLDNIDSDANLFSLRLSRPYNSVEVNTVELRETIEAVTKATGATEVDLVVHSLGGLNARNYLQGGDEKVNKLVMLGTPNHGSALADMERFFRENFEYPILPPVDDPEVRRVLEQLSVDKMDGDKPQNPWLRELNNNWEQQRDKADILLVAGAGIPTVTGGPGLTIFGDGVVTRRSAKMSGIERKTSWFRTHGGLLKSAKVMETTAKFLTGQPLPASENLFDRPEDVLKAAELMDGPGKSEPGDMQKVSTEQSQRAARLPLLDPAFQMGLALGVLSSMMGGSREVLPLVEIGLNSASQDREVQANYNVDLEREEGQVQGSGFVDGRAFAEVADFQEGKMYWKSALGLQSSGLTMEVGEDEKSVTLKGEMGGVPTDLKINLLSDNGQMISGLETTGLFNGENYYVKSKVDMGNLLDGQPLHHGVMEVNGNVNGEDMERRYHVDVLKEPGGLEFRARKEAANASEQSIGVTVKVKER